MAFLDAKNKDTLFKVGLVGGIAAGAYLIWKYVLNGGQTPGAGCPAGTHYEDACASYQGLPKALCEIGRFASGGMGLECIDDAIPPVPVPLPIDEHGCLIGTQKWCPREEKCRDTAQSCEPTGGCPPYTEWSPLLGQCIHTGEMRRCPDGSWHFPETPCPESIPACAESECEPGITACFQGVSKRCVPLGIGCETRGIWSNGGNACAPVTNIVDCGNGCGLVDLNNPPGTTCEAVCAPLWVPGCVQDIAECRRLETNTPGGLLRGFMNADACRAMGGIVQPGGYCANQAALDYDRLRSKACCY